MIYVEQVENSQSKLRNSRPFLEHLLERMNVDPTLKNSTLYVGGRNAEVEIAPLGLRTAQCFDKCGSATGLYAHEVSYSLPYIQHNGNTTGKPWSLQHFFVYNKSGLTRDSSKWIMLSLPEAIRTRVQDHLQVVQANAALNPLDIHVLVCKTVIGMWKPFFIELTERIESRSQIVGASDPADGSSVQGIDPGMLGILMGLELDILDAKGALHATVATLQRIKTLFDNGRSLDKDAVHTKNDHARKMTDSSMSDGLLDLQQLIEHTTELSQELGKMSALYTNFLDLASEFYQDLARDQVIENNEAMKKLAKATTRETKALKALIFVTLVCLPITMVLNMVYIALFRVDKGKGQNVGTWWVLFWLSLPLTVLAISNLGVLRSLQPKTRLPRQLNRPGDIWCSSS